MVKKNVAPSERVSVATGITVLPHTIDERDLYIIRVESSTWLRLSCAAAKDCIALNDVAERAIHEYLWREYGL